MVEEQCVDVAVSTRTLIGLAPVGIGRDSEEELLSEGLFIQIEGFVLPAFMEEKFSNICLSFLFAFIAYGAFSSWTGVIQYGLNHYQHKTSKS